ncbi:MAG: hypothetical protein ACK44O_05280, partial [Novosphingobium sp.]
MHRTGQTQRRIWSVRTGLLAACLLSPMALRAESAREGSFEEVGLNFDIRHLGNASRTDPATAAARGLVQSDQRLTVGVDVVISRNLGRNTLKIQGNVGYDFYRRNTRLNRERIGIGAQTGVNVGPCLADVSARLDRRQSDLESIGFVNLPGIDSIENTETIQSYRVEGRCGYVYGLRPSLGYEHRRGDNSNSLRELSDYKSNRVFGGISYQHPVVGQARLTFEHEDISYNNRAGTPLAALSGYKVDELRLQLSRDIGTLLTANAMVAYNWLKPDNRVTPGYKGLTWQIGGTLKPGTRLQISASTSQSINPAMAVEALYSKRTMNEAQAVYAVSERISVKGGFSFSKVRYGGAQANFGPLLDRDSFRRIFAGMTYRANRRLELGVEGGHEKRNGTGALYDYSSGY